MKHQRTVNNGLVEWGSTIPRCSGFKAGHALQQNWTVVKGGILAPCSLPIPAFQTFQPGRQSLLLATESVCMDRLLSTLHTPSIWLPAWACYMLVWLVFVSYFTLVLFLVTCLFCRHFPVFVFSPFSQGFMLHVVHTCACVLLSLHPPTCLFSFFLGPWGKGYCFLPPGTVLVFSA